MLQLFHSGDRPGPGWHRHGTTAKTILLVDDGRRVLARLVKQRWLDTSTGHTCHDRPVWDRPGAPYALDVVVLALGAWLLSCVGLHAVAWPWTADRPSRRTVQRWAAFLGKHARDWLQDSRQHLIDYVAPRPLEDLLPTGGVPPPEGVRSRAVRKNGVATAGTLRDVIWLHESMAQALYIPLRSLLVVARWRWPREPRQQQPL